MGENIKDDFSESEIAEYARKQEKIVKKHAKTSLFFCIFISLRYLRTAYIINKGHLDLNKISKDQEFIEFLKIYTIVMAGLFIILGLWHYFGKSNVARILLLVIFGIIISLKIYEVKINFELLLYIFTFILLYFANWNFKMKPELIKIIKSYEKKGNSPDIKPNK